MNIRKKNLFKGILLGSLTLGFVLSSYTHIASAATTPALVLTWSDEFSGSAVDTNVWNVEDGINDSYGGDQQAWTPANAVVTNGMLNLLSKRESLDDMDYTSAALTTKNKMTFGGKGNDFRLEVRAKVPTGQGVWPAIWMLEGTMPDPVTGTEVDLLEVLGNDTTRGYMNEHVWVNGSDTNKPASCEMDGTNLAAGYHTYAVQQTGTTMQWLVDGVQRCSSNVVPTLPSYLLLNTSIGGGWPGEATANTPMPQTFAIDYVRLYQKSLPDTTLPVVSISAPTDTQTVSGTVPITATATDNTSVSSAQIFVDGTAVNTCSSFNPCNYSWNSRSVANGVHQIKVTAKDAANNQASSTVSVTVDNELPLPVCSLSINPTSIMSGESAALSWTSQNATAFSIDQSVGSVDTSVDGSVNVSPTKNTKYTGTVSGGYNETATCTASITVIQPDTTLPTVSLSAPSNGATVSGSAVTISATASDNVGVVGVQFKLDGNNIGAEDTTSPYSISWDSSSTANGSHSLTATARDAAGNIKVSSSRSITVNNDTTPPTVSLSAPADGANVSGASVTISATATDNKSVAGVKFMLDGNLLGTEDTSDPYSIVWNTTTATNGAHVLTALARDTSGNLSIPNSRTVNVNNDAIAPSVSISAPNNSDTVMGSIAVSANASDDIGVVGVQFKLNGVNLSTEDTTAPYSITWDTTSIANGQHVLTAVARDAAGNKTTSAAVVVSVSNPDITAPTVALSAPANNATVSGATTVSATASDNVGVLGVQFTLDGNNLGDEDLASPYSISWSTLATGNGTHVLSAIARDAAGNTKIATSRTVTVNNDTTPPQVSITSPANGSKVSGTVTISATASDNKGVAGVKFKLDGINLNSEDTSSPYSTSWNTTASPNGPHTLTATARDAAGNTTDSITLVVNVANTVSYSPSNYSVNTGTYQSGNTASLVSDDSNFLAVKSTTNGSSRQSSDDFTVTGVTQPSRLDYSVRLKSSVSSTTVIISAYNYATATWTQISSSTVDTSEATKTASITSSAQNYVDPSGTTLFRVQSSRSQSFTLSYEMLKLTATP